MNMASMRRPSTITRMPPDLVIVKVGSDLTEYHIHKALLVDHSEYFKKALNGPWKEAKEGTISFDDVGCETFSIFVDWLYTQKLPTSIAHPANSTTQEEGFLDALFKTQLEAIVFGNRIIASEFSKEIESQMFEESVGGDYKPSFDTIIYAFANIAFTSPILQLLVDCHCRWYNAKKDQGVGRQLELEAQLPKEFLLRVMKGYSQLLENHMAPELTTCVLHSHHSRTARVVHIGVESCCGDSDYDPDSMDDE